MAFHGCLCTECDQLYGYVGTLPSGKKIVYGKCQYGWQSVRFIELVLEAEANIRRRGDEVTPDSIGDEIDSIMRKRKQEAEERSERAELRRLERKYRSRARH